MKLSGKQLRIISGFLFVTGAIIVVVTRNFNSNHPDDPINYGKWIGIGVMIVGLLLLSPWKKEDEK